ncbi:MAG: translation initiation factor IF-2 [Gemmataceae bacterium]|nr:translation initiation factor IF-2 [Gemmataceae bacterium]
MRDQAAGRSITPPAPGTVPAPAVDAGEDDDEKKRRSGGVAGRADRHKDRAERQAKRKEGDVRGGGGGRISVDDDENQRYRKGRKHHVKPQPKGTVARKGKIPISLPITVRTLSEAIGRKSNDIIAKLMLQGVMVTINSAIDPDTAQLMALEYGCELEIKQAADQEVILTERDKEEDAPESLVPRAPIVVIMGHVDHGKTSILDKIKGDNIVATEAGGITQVLRAWRIDHDGHPITFLDTPGHEAFTKMRARGANVTDIAVIVVAANDGVMPQTEEAISHAKAAEVHIIVAINKVDLPDANLRKTQQQLYSLGLVPDTMGGDVPFVECSAKTGAGIDELLEQISLVAELAELKANPDKKASGTVLEAYLSEKEGVQATLLVQGGTLREGDVIVAGAAYGTVRRMFDDRGQPITEAGPSVPVRILGLDAVPNADDPFGIVDDITTAREIAEQRKDRAAEQAQTSRAPVDLMNLAKITELKVILKAEARGSVEAIRAELEKIKHEEVRVRVLHTGIGGITSSDVQLALTSPEDTLILGFNVVPDLEAKALAEERGIQIKEYDIIYRLVEDIRNALEGKLKPLEQVIHLGRANVREVFKIGKVGTIAGCVVTTGTIERSALVRIIRGGSVIYPPAERTAKLESLRRFKEDAREVREGFECGIKIANYDDIKVGDTIEAYRIEQVQRKLD